MPPANSSASEISLNEIEGERDSTDDFVFVRIGSSIPLSSSSFSFDFQSPPSQPLSISNRHGLLFISHPQQGFLVVKTNDVIAASKEIKEDNSKELSVEDVCVMDVKIGSVEILAVSDDEDESLLAAAAGDEIFFYNVASLLNKMQEPAFSSSLGNSATIKDFKWQKKTTDTSYVVLSTHGSLYHSTSEARLNKIMDGVDAVDWSREGDCIAVARKHSISILSSDFKEILNMSLIFESRQTLTDPGGTIIVDSIKWLLDDSIILGCHQVDEDGAEEGYLIQVIKSQKKNFSEMSCNPIVYGFSDLFDGVWDILPSGSGPYLLANYLDHWGAVLMSNKKAIDQHISLLKLSSVDDNNKVVALELISDKYTPKIEVPVNGDDNLVFGFCIGTVFTYEKINIKVDENVHELSPRYALFCLTSEGKLILFHAARISEPLDLHKTLPHLDDGDVEERQCNTNFLNESIAKPVLNGIQIPTSKDLPKQINMEPPNFQKGTFELPGNTISPHKQEVGTFTGQTEKFNNLFSDTVNSGDVESSAVSKGAFASSSHGGATVSYFGSESINKTHRDNQNEAHQRNNSSIFHPSSQLASSKDLSVNSQPSALSGKPSYKSSVVSKGAFASSSHDGAIVSYFGSESTNDKTYRHNQNKAHQQSNSSIFHSSSQLASGKDFTVISQPSTFSEKSSYKNKENLCNSLSMTRDANNGHTLQGSDVAEHEDSLHGKLDLSTAQSLLERIRASKSQDKTKQFYNVKDMTEELDILLSYIEKEGGFKDACTSYQENSVHALEHDLGHLSERSHNCKKSIEEQLMDIQQLQNKILQVSARQSYMKGIVEQASNKTYWDIWNRQKLNPELEIKQQNILNANQNLTREIIELERHFNTLEINKFGDVGRSTLDHAAFRRSQMSSRQRPSLQSLYNTVNSQLSAAEQLSECLSKQLSDLNIKSGSVEKKSITQELFESIGLSREHNSFQSPPVCKTDSLLPNSIRRTPLSTTNSPRGYNQKNSLSLIKASEPETARRRRDSLDRNWTTFTPPKTTVKRATPEKFSRVDKDVPFRKAKESFDAKKRDFTTHQKRVQDSRYKQQVEVGSNVIPRWTNETSGSRPTESNSNPVGIQRTFTLSQSLSHSFSTSSGTKNSTKNTYGTPKTSSSEITLARNPANPLFANINSNTKTYSQMQNIFGQTQSSANFSSNISSINNRTITESSVQTRQNLEDSFSSSAKDSNSSSLSTTTAFASNFSKNITAASQPNGPKSTNLDSPFKLPTSTSFSTQNLPSTTATTAPLTSSSVTSMSFGNSLFSGKLVDPTSTLAATSTSLSIHPISSSPSSSSSSSTTSSSLPLSALSSSSLFPSASSFGQPSFSAFTSSSTVPVSTTTTKPSPSTISSESKPASPKSVTSEKVETSVPNSSSNSLSTNNTNMPSFNSLSQPVTSSTSMPSITEDKGKPSDANLSDQDEDGMEEEAPDTTSGFNLGSLSGIGLGSTMSSTPPKQNPFGGSFLTSSSSNQSSTSSPFALQTSTGQGELFRPASFTIPSAQPTHPSSQGAFSGFGQTSRIGVGQQALGNVLGSFGASRQIGAGIVQNSGSSSTSNVTNSGFGVTAPVAAGGGFASAAVKVGGFAAVASGSGGGFGAFGSGGGFAGAGSGGGFGGAGSNASSGFGFAAANNAGAANNAAGGFGAAGAASGFKSDGFGGFGNNQGGSGGGMFSSFGGNNASAGPGKPPASLLTQMRK